jgi:hypothetical protein
MLTSLSVPAFELLLSHVCCGSLQSAVDRLRDQLNELVAALQLRGHVKGVKLAPVLVEPGRICCSPRRDVSLPAPWNIPALLAKKPSARQF